MFMTALLATAIAAPPAKEVAKEKVYYHPTVEGTKRVWQLKTPDGTSEQANTVTKVQEKDGVYTVWERREINRDTVEFRFEVSAEGLFALSQSGEKVSRTAVLKLPAKEGESWTVERSGGGQGIAQKTTYTTGKEEEVEVPAGKFKAIAVASGFELDGVTYKKTAWYAPGAGVVKVVSVSNGKEQVQVLKEFTPGKAKGDKKDK